MNNKIMSIFVCTLIISTAFSMVGIAKNNEVIKKAFANPGYNIYNCGPTLDQKQDRCEGGWCVCDGGFSWFAQAFRPALSNLVQIELRMWKIADPNDYDLTLSIRDSLDGDDIASKTINGSVVSSRLQWILFEFEIINLTPGETYYMVIRGNGGNDNAGYVWCGYWGDEDVYPDGEAWDNAVGGKWTVRTASGYEFFDFCFRTYGWNYAPSIPVIDGPTSVKTEEENRYIFNSTDPEGNPVYYFVDWGDNTTINWMGPYHSGEAVSINHTFYYSRELGNARIIRAKAKDRLGGGESDWATLEVSMPKNKILNINPLFLQFLENHPHMFPILQKILLNLG